MTRARQATCQRAAWTVTACLVLGLVTACETGTWRTPGAIRPVSYTPVADAPDAGVGMLRRLAVVSAGFEYHGPGDLGIAMGAKEEEEEAGALRLERTLIDISMRVVGGRQGYDLVEARPENAAGDLTPDVWEAHLRRLAEWAGGAAEGARAPPETVAAVRALSAAHGTDGVLLLRGYANEDTDAAFVATMLTASLLWPLMMVEERLALAADIFQASDGQPVWRARWSSNMESAGAGLLDNRILGLYAGLEPALPALLEAGDDDAAAPE